MTDALSCSLPAAELDERARTWRTLDRYVRSRTRIASGIRIEFDGRAAAGVEGLAAAEQSCCAWGNWAVTVAPDAVVLEVTGPAERIEALAGVVGVPDH
ncbi:MAG: hypothetical protein ABSG81_14040 [Acidimicrobiales bacterium]